MAKAISLAIRDAASDNLIVTAVLWDGWRNIFAASEVRYFRKVFGIAI
jgi:hypothetical protein